MSIYKHRDLTLFFTENETRTIISDVDMPGFKSINTAYATIKRIKAMCALRKGQAESLYFDLLLAEGRPVNRAVEI